MGVLTNVNDAYLKGYRDRRWVATFAGHKICQNSQTEVSLATFLSFGHDLDHRNHLFTFTNRLMRKRTRQRGAGYASNPVLCMINRLILGLIRGSRRHGTYVRGRLGK
jgi:hypothetical protein